MESNITVIPARKHEAERTLPVLWCKWQSGRIVRILPVRVLAMSMDAAKEKSEGKA